MNSEKVIEVKGLTKRFKEVTAVNNLDLNVHRGDVFGFLGPNGAGKSTTIRLLLSLIRPTSGSVKIFNRSLQKNRKEIMKKVGGIVEKPDFYLYLSAYKNLEILARMSGVDASRNRIMEMLELVGLADRYKSKVKTYSHGMNQRLGIAQALLHDPELIILDEPTTGLDPQGMKDIRDLIIYLSKEKNKTIFLSSHILREVELIATRMIIIDKGTTKVEGNVTDLLNSEKMNVSFEVDDTNKSLKLINESQWQNNYKESLKENIIMEINKEDIPLLNKYFVENGIKVSSVIPTRSLEEFFLKITESSGE